MSAFKHECSRKCLDPRMKTKELDAPETDLVGSRDEAGDLQKTEVVIRMKSPQDDRREDRRTRSKPVLNPGYSDLIY